MTDIATNELLNRVGSHFSIARSTAATLRDYRSSNRPSLIHILRLPIDQRL